jgi:anti-sigma regulatory factor (Ser/Thr protein kinase)
MADEAAGQTAGPEAAHAPTPADSTGTGPAAAGGHPWPRAAVPAANGDVWHWQLNTVPRVSRARVDLRSRIGHPSMSVHSTADARDGLLLAFEELASNALRHGGGDVRAVVVAGTWGWLLDVSDEAPAHPPVPAVDRDPALGGMGLPLVEQLAAEYGWEGRPGRKHVWALLPSGLTLTDAPDQADGAHQPA